MAGSVVAGVLFAAVKHLSKPPTDTADMNVTTVTAGGRRFDVPNLTSQTGQMKRLNATEFKSGCLALLDQVARSGESITITKRGKPVAQLVPVRPSNVRYPQDALRGTVRVLGDVLSPALSPADWEVERRRR